MKYMRVDYVHQGVVGFSLYDSWFTPSEAAAAVRELLPGVLILGAGYVVRTPEMCEDVCRSQ